MANQCVDILDLHPHPYRMRLQIKGLSQRFFGGTPEGTRLHFRPGMDGNEGVMPVEPGMSSSPPDCCI